MYHQARRATARAPLVLASILQSIKLKCNACSRWQLGTSRATWIFLSASVTPLCPSRERVNISQYYVMLGGESSSSSKPFVWTRR